ncbi:protein FAM169B [Engraulis encrasicolus]|uniref:protein FAM169B n=1 Tax=Engraulis encrasicolus TaxID=184585 RepID=UPI002FCFFA96
MESKQRPSTGVKYPVDCSDENYCHLSDQEVPCLDNGLPKKPLMLPHGVKVDVCRENIARLSLFSGDASHSVFVLHLPGDASQVVAVHLHGEWWPLQEAMKTSCKSRCGLVVVKSLMERVLLSLMSQVMYGLLERAQDEDMYFSPHAQEEFGKIFWKDSEAAGFYTVKRKGGLCTSWGGQTYLLPVLDTVFVRTAWRRRGLALEMLRDFCSSHPHEEALGISHPISAAMYEVCRRFLVERPEERERMCEVEGPGDWAQRRNVWLRLQLQLQRLPQHRTGQSPQTIASGSDQEDTHTDGNTHTLWDAHTDEKDPPTPSGARGHQTSCGQHVERRGVRICTRATAAAAAAAAAGGHPLRRSERRQRAADHHTGDTQDTVDTKRTKTHH